MCIGIPMQVTIAESGFAFCLDRGEHRRISTLLVGDCAPGDWLLVFLEDAREKIDSARAAEINEVLAMLQLALKGQPDEITVPEFILPSSMSVAEVNVMVDQAHQKNDQRSVSISI